MQSYGKILGCNVIFHLIGVFVNTTFLAMSISILMGIGLLLTIGALSLLSGALNFLFVKPKIAFYKSQFGENGFAFSFTWDQSAEAVKYNSVKIQLYNPFGSPEQLEITKQFDSSAVDFIRDLDLGPKMKELLNAKGLEKATVEIKFSSAEGISHQQLMKGIDFKDQYKAAKQSIEEVKESFSQVKEKSRYEIPERTFISPPLPKSAKALKLATNPEFAGQFAGGGAEASVASTVANFTVSKVWIEPGCIVCDACEGIYPEVFEVTDSTCLIRAGAPLDDGLKIQEAAEACPVEVIKFTKVG